ncbi:tetratricopeptide repeat protein [Devosia ginsengisoli]|uniref:tetratricopeptide repeat protein n=1 Tax=Devosia ginsengisoli TaxID=400770 RepID=UPI0034E98142
MVLQHKPDHPGAIIGMAKVFFTAEDPEQAQAVLDTMPEAERKGEEYNSLIQSLKLLGEAAELSETDELAAEVEADPDNHQARFDLAVKYNAEGKRLEAAEALVALMKRDRTWNEDGARKKLLELFEAWGAKDPATLKGRRLLSALLFS